MTSSGELTIVPVFEIAQSLGYTLKKEKASYYIYRGSEKVAYIIPGQDKMHTASGTVNLKTPAEVDANGELIMALDDLSNVLLSKNINAPYFPISFIYDEGVHPEAVYASGYEKNNKLYRMSR